MARHLTILDRALTDIATGRLKRLIVEMPPRHGKSELTSKYFPAWYLGTFPERDIILTSATDDLALDFSAASRDLVDEHGAGVFGVSLRRDVAARHRWQLDQGGSLRAAGVGGGIMGRGANLLIVDDYFKNVEEALSETQRKKVHQWYMSTSSTRLTPDGAVVVVATRWHPRDLIGQLLADSEMGGEKWEVVRLQAIAEADDRMGRADGEALWPEQFSADWLYARRDSYYASGYGWMWEALYQQHPPEVLDAEWSPEYFTDAVWFDDWPADEQIQWRVMALDPSVGRTDKADYSAYVLLAVDWDLNMWVDADLSRRDVSRMIDDGLALAKAWQPHAFGVEANQFQAVLADMFWERAARIGAMVNAKGIINTHNKLERIRAGLTEYLARGKMRFRRGSPGAALLVEQLKGFPSCKYDDGPDALEMAVRLVGHVVANGLDDGNRLPERMYA